jgi:SCY1-like protein 3
VVLKCKSNNFYLFLQLLVGIKDNDDDLVAKTLRALADLVPLLGAATVIGGKRGKLFTDGRPKV